MKKYLLVCLLFFNACVFNNGDIKFNLKLEGKRYDSLELRCITGKAEDEKYFYFPGTTTDGYDWHFVIPKDVYYKNSTLRFADPQKTDSVWHRLFFSGDNHSTGDFFNFEAINTVTAKFKETYNSRNERLFNVGKRDGTSAEMHAEWDCFILPEDQAQKLIGEIEAAVHTFKDIRFTENENYGEDLSYNINLVSENPDNALLCKELYWSVYGYKTKKDASEIFEKFSKKAKKSYYGQKLNNYLYEIKFPNHKLLSMQTGKKEAIVQDFSKYNLIIFSASWCAPCIKAIPKYKQIYEDFKDKLIITYISEDEPKYIDRWEKLMKEHEIEWRSLLTMDELGIIKNKYFAQIIPYVILVSPDKTMVPIELYAQEDMDKLYAIINQ